jgi:hypothetical protein
MRVGFRAGWRTSINTGTVTGDAAPLRIQEGAEACEPDAAGALEGAAALRSAPHATPAQQQAGTAPASAAEQPAYRR